MSYFKHIVKLSVKEVAGVVNIDLGETHKGYVNHTGPNDWEGGIVEVATGRTIYVSSGRNRNQVVDAIVDNMISLHKGEPLKSGGIIW